jgi:hypothetical protein
MNESSVLGAISGASIVVAKRDTAVYRYRCANGHEWEQSLWSTGNMIGINGRDYCVRCIAAFLDQIAGCERVKEESNG